MVDQRSQGDTPVSGGAATLLLVLDKPIDDIAPVRLAGPADSALWTGGKRLNDLGWGYINDTCIVGGFKGATRPSCGGRT